MTNVPDPLAAFLGALDLEATADSTYRGRAAAGNRRRVFGGLAMGQALVAASRTIGAPGLAVRSLHCMFGRAGDPAAPISYVVDALSDGRTFVTRSVDACQSGNVLFRALVRFGGGEPGPAYQRPQPPGAVPEPESLPDYPTVIQPQRDRLPDWAEGNLPIDLRPIGEAGTGEQVAWLRAISGLPEDEIVHASALLYATDMTLLGVAPTPFGLEWATPGLAMATLDHAIWFHSPARADEWLLFQQQAVSNASGLALVTGHLFSRDGGLVATVTQHGLVRLPPDDRPDGAALR